uniref:ribonuclease III n=1 Tax=Glossina brevipalpis TaxID=37001 RepID=A0A1A9W8L5_9MUSC
MEESKEKNMKARSYQLELVDYVCQRNGIIYLPTGAGKTFVAILALKRLSASLQHTIAEGGKRAIYMCNTVELARQQCVEVRKCTNFKVGLYVGEREVDNWSNAKWSEEITENQVLVGTAQIFVDIINQNLIKITDVSVVIIDECHHATKNHPMHTFLSLFQYVDQSQLPRVIGLTGVLVKGNKFKSIQKELNNLEATFRGKIVTINSVKEFNNVMFYSTKPKEELVEYKRQEREPSKIEDNIFLIVQETKAVIDRYDIGNVPLKLTKGLAKLQEPSKKKFIKNFLDDFLYQMNDLGLYAASFAILSAVIDFEVKKRQSETTTLRNLYRFVITRCENIRHIIIQELKSMVKEEDIYPIKDSICNVPNVIYHYSTPKLRAFLLSLTSLFKGKKPNDISCLVFVERRYTAKCIYYVLLNYLKQTPELKDVIRPQFMVGRKNILYSIESILDSKWNKSAMDQFRNKECNLIVCSNVLEEGIDVQACNYVFVLDELKTFNSYIQTKGRARSKDAYYTIFCEISNLEKVRSKICSYRETHEEIKEFLSDRLLECDDQNQQEVDQQFMELIPPFQIESGARLLATSALMLLHRYCQSLPWDSFGCVMPCFAKLPSNSTGAVAVSVTLPLQSTIRETITSDYMHSWRGAKISAAFKACVKLYKEGALNDYLLPVSKTECIAKVSEELFKNWKKYNDDVTLRAVGKSHLRLYERKCPKELYAALPQVGQISYVYAIQFFTDFVTNPYNAHVVKYLNNTCTYALMLSKKLPLLAEMPLFMSQGKIRVRISKEPIEFILETKQQLNLLENFHTMIFKDLLQLWRDFLVIDRRNLENSYLLVPLNSSQSIDWQLVQDFQCIEPARSYSITERRRNVCRPEDYLDKVVTKWYTKNDDERYVVVKVRQDLNPLSQFDNNQFQNYMEYYQSRYNITVADSSQFLLEVKALTKRRNFFINALGKSTEIKRDRNDIILIPELCHNFHYPGYMWLKALFLPNILHRIYYMLHADELRLSINQFLGLKNEFNLYHPHPLIVDISLKRAVDTDGNAIKEEECRKPKKFPSSLTRKSPADTFKVHSLNNIEATWKEYMEPMDYSRNLIDVFPVELEYYHKFINGSVEGIKNFCLQDEQFYSRSQLEVAMPPAPNVARNTDSEYVVLPIEYKCSYDKYHLDILTRSLESNYTLKSAEQYELLAAITAAGVNDVFDMERYELLGDAFLKFSASLFLANKYPKWHEGFLTTIKGRMVSNRNLLYCMLEMDICQKICASPFSPSTSWLPPLASLPVNLLKLFQTKQLVLSSLTGSNFYSLKLSQEEILSGVCHADKLDEFLKACNKPKDVHPDYVGPSIESDMNPYVYKEALRDKVVADTLEALLGVCVKNYGIHRTFCMLEYFGIVKSDSNIRLPNLLDLRLDSTQLRANTSQREVDGFLVNCNKLEENLNYKFQDRAYLLQAITHPSFPTNRLTGCYQELEFIGDAILDMLVTCYIFERYQNMTAGMMTDMRMALVNNITLGCICVRHRFHLFMLYENSALSEAIRLFADFQETQQQRVTDQVRILMEEYTTIDSDFEENSDDNCGVELSFSRDGSNEANPLREDINLKRNFNIASNVDVPKALGDVVEAIIAAVYLDSRDLQTTWRVIYGLLENEFIEFSSKPPIDPVRQLTENKGADAKFSIPVRDNDVVMIKCEFNCLDKSMEANGFGSNAEQAKKAAAKAALRILSKLAN